VTDPNTGRSYLVGQEETTSVLYLADPSSKTIRSIQTPKGYDGIGKYSLGLVASGDGSVLAVEAPIHSSLPRRSGADLFLIDVNSGRMHRVTWYPHWWIMHERPLVWTLIILISLWAASAWGALAAGVGRDDAKRFNLMILILGTGILAWIALLHGWPGWPLLAFGISAAVTEVFAPHPRHFLYRRKRNSWQPIGM